MTIGKHIVDCTIRDGGLVNEWAFTPEFVADLYAALDEAGVEYMEVGYKNSARLLGGGGNAGPWRFLDDRYLSSVIPNKGATKLSALVDIGRVDENDILPRAESPLDLIRVACYIADVAEGIALAAKFKERGYETSINIMALSGVSDGALIVGLRLLAASTVDIVYVVDSFGTLTPQEIGRAVAVFQEHLPGKKLGVHTHNNMQLALANTLEASRLGVAYLDASVYGMGRAAGNCHTELLLAAVKENAYNIRPVLGVIEKHMLGIRANWEWGYNIPYALAGILNEHPRTAMALRSSAERDEYVKFYDKLTGKPQEAVLSLT